MAFKDTVKTAIFFCLNAISTFLPRHRSAVLLYHSIDDNDVYLTVKPEIFEKQAQYLKENDYRVISLKELAGIIRTKKEIQPKTVVLTFDDGFLSHYEKVFPILKKYNFPATFFVSTGLVGGSMNNSQGLPQSTMTWEQIKEMSQSPLIDIEPHGVSHKDFSKIPLLEAEREIIESKNEIEQRLNKKCFSFAFPRGGCNQDLAGLVKRRGFETAVTIKKGLVKTGDDIFMLKRNTVDSSCDNNIQFLARLNWSVVLFDRLTSPLKF